MYLINASCLSIGHLSRMMEQEQLSHSCALAGLDGEKACQGFSCSSRLKCRTFTWSFAMLCPLVHETSEKATSIAHCTCGLLYLTECTSLTSLSKPNAEWYSLIFAKSASFLCKPLSLRTSPLYHAALACCAGYRMLKYSLLFKLPKVCLARHYGLYKLFLYPSPMIVPQLCHGV